MVTRTPAYAREANNCAHEVEACLTLVTALGAIWSLSEQTLQWTFDRYVRLIGCAKVYRSIVGISR